MLSKRAQQTLNFIQKFISCHHYAPTLAEIAKGLGITSNGVVHRYVKLLEREQLLSFIPGHKRNIKLTLPTQESAYELPIAGQIAAGKPILAVEQLTRFDLSTLCKPQRFILQVKGDSMIGDNICDGDYIICETRAMAASHEIAVVLIDNEEATLKRIKTNGDGTIQLIPSNPNLTTQCYPATRITIQGIYKGLIRINNI